MIKYSSGSFGYSILFRVHGSALYKSLFPSCISSAIFIILFNILDLETEEVFLHPYPMGALISALTFLLAFRANFSYGRLWESYTAVHQMHSKWLDVGMQLAAFHLQSAVYSKRRPPAFGSYPEINSLERARERLNELTLEELETQLEELEKEGKIDEVTEENNALSLRSRAGSVLRLRRRRNSQQTSETSAAATTTTTTTKAKTETAKTKNAKAKVKTKVLPPAHHTTRPKAKSINAVPTKPAETTYSKPAVGYSPFNQIASWFFFKQQPRELEKRASQTQVQSSMTNQVRAWDPDKPPLFLQEGAHLLSLLSAVAFSTLRNDVEEADSPLITFTEGAPWPHVDPDAYTADVRKGWTQSGHRSVTVLRYILSISRTPTARTLYNAARPFRVIGGVSDAEIELLQAARGPLAKVALVTMWLQEFISREYLAGSMGAVAPPILSRLYQYTSDGMIGYNQARKVAYIPFPFPHAQITSLFVLLVVGFMPVLMLSFLTNEIFSFFMNFLTVMCFTGLHEVARELENPFINTPNDVPLNNFQAQFNESLLQMFTGYHPDAFWEVVVKEESQRAEEESERENKENPEDVKGDSEGIQSTDDVLDTLDEGVDAESDAEAGAEAGAGAESDEEKALHKGDENV